jgi:hypothetical protein
MSKHEELIISVGQLGNYGWTYWRLRITNTFIERIFEQPSAIVQKHIMMHLPIDLSLLTVLPEKYSGINGDQHVADNIFSVVIAEILDRLVINEETFYKFNPYFKSDHSSQMIIKKINSYRLNNRHLIECRIQLEKTNKLLQIFMPTVPTEEEEIAQADDRAKQGAVKHREATEKMRKLMRSPEAESIRLQESEYPSVAEHILRAGRRTRRTKK